MSQAATAYQQGQHPERGSDGSVILALDIGTSSCKGAVFAPDGRMLAAARDVYPTHRHDGHRVEQDPADWWRAVIAVCRELTAAVPSGAIAAIGLSGQVPTMVLADDAGQALLPAISWQDRRAEAEATWLREEIGPARLAEWFGMDLPIDPGWPPARLLWWRRHEPEAMVRAARVLMAKDVILARLTGALSSDAWSAKGLVHLTKGTVPDAFYAAIDVPARLAPPVLPPAAPAGVVHAAGAAATGLPVGTPVVAGWSDALCGMYGTGALAQPGQAFDLTGTSEIIGCSGLDAAPNLMHVPSAVTGTTSVLYGPTQSGGDSLVWFAELVGQPVPELIALAAAAPAGAGGVRFLPYLLGERAPLWDSAARGALVGLHREHGAGIGARAVLEGVAMSVRHVLDACGVGADPSRTLRLAGGSARDDTWNQIRADVTGLTVEVVEQPEATLLGAAMLGAVGAGLYPDLPAASAMIRLGRRFAPDPGTAALYDTAYVQYRALYPALAGVFARTAGNLTRGGEA